MARSKNSKARLVIEMLGPSEEVANAVETLVHTAGGLPVQVSYPEPCRIEPVVRVRKAREEVEP